MPRNCFEVVSGELYFSLLIVQAKSIGVVIYRVHYLTPLLVKSIAATDP